MGASGVGKSSLINALCPEFNRETNTVSERTKRGQHTTRTVRLLNFGAGYIADTPGFGAADTASIPKEELAALFREFTTYFDRCRFKPCSHTHEPDCAVKSAVAEGLIAVERYDAYIDMIKNYK